MKLRSLALAFTAIVGLSGAANASWTNIAQTAAGGSNCGGVTTPAINTTGADLIVVSISYYGGAAPTLSDTDHLSFSQAVTVANSYGPDNEVIKYVHLSTPSSDSSHTFSLSSNGSCASLAVQAFSGSVASPLDQIGSVGSTSNVTSMKPSSITPTQDGELLITALGTDVNGGSGLTAGPSVDSGFAINASAVYSPGNFLGDYQASLVQPAAAAVSPTWSWTGSVPATAVTVSFKGIASPAGPSIDMSDNSHVAPGANGTYLGVVNGSWANGQPGGAAGPQGPAGPAGTNGTNGTNAGQSTYPACPSPTATATVGQSQFCSNGSHTDIAVAPAANTWVFFGPASSTAP